MPRIFTVSEITGALKEVVETEFPFVWVKGQVTNLAQPASGHIYFSLGDGQAVLPVVWFKANQWIGGEDGVHPLTGEVCEPDIHPLTGEVCESGPLRLADGADVLVAGRLTAYPPRGTYQLVAELVEEQGVSALALQFEALKRDLAAKGYFDQDRKMVLPPSPQRVAVVTSPHGAAIRDFVRIAAGRGPGAEIRIQPTPVQGAEAPARIATAIREACADNWAQAIAVIRGGGSLEDLWAFNDPGVAEAIFHAHIPVVCGVGHEVDVSIADLVADVRAATPSHAAQLLWRDRGELWQALDEADMRLARTFNRHFTRASERFANLERTLLLLSPMRRLERRTKRLESATGRLLTAWERFFCTRRDSLDAAQAGLARAHGARALEAREDKLADLSRRLSRAAAEHTARHETALDKACIRLDGLDPEKPLARGYSLVRVEKTGRFLRDPAEVTEGDTLAIRVQKGAVRARVDDTTSPEPGDEK
jgi:exodeoxyribonuclease VII large subunit